MRKELDIPDTGFGRPQSQGFQYWLSETHSTLGPDFQTLSRHQAGRCLWLWPEAGCHFVKPFTDLFRVLAGENEAFALPMAFSPWMKGQS